MVLVDAGRCYAQRGAIFAELCDTAVLTHVIWPGQQILTRHPCKRGGQCMRGDKHLPR